MTDQSGTYDPLAYENLGNSVVNALLSRDIVAMTKMQKFQGAGIYTIYYTGEFPLYAPLVKINLEREFSLPIYVGKAIPKGARKGGRGIDGGYSLHTRLCDHKDSIEACTTTLQIEDFYCRYLVVKDVWIPMAESMLIEKFKPLWNVVIEGFGNHDPGKGREKGQKPIWDTLHPGRNWAEKLIPNRINISEINKKVEFELNSLK